MSRVVEWRRTTYGLVAGAVMLGLGLFGVFFALTEAMYLEEEALGILFMCGFCVISGIVVIIVSAVQRSREEQGYGYDGYRPRRRKRAPVY